MPTQPANQEAHITTLSREQRDWIRRQGRVTRAIEAAQRRSSGRFTRIGFQPRWPSGSGRRVSSP